jgi:hypothetical protein
MVFAPESEVDPIEPGATLISSGFDNSVFPKGLAIGVIEQRGLDPYGLPIGVTRPAVPMREVEDVLVVMPRERAAAGKLEPAFAVADAPTSPRRSFTVAMPTPATLAEDTTASSTRAASEPGASHDARSPAVSLPMVVLPKPGPRSAQRQEPPVPPPAAFNERRDAPSEETQGGNP